MIDASRLSQPSPAGDRSKLLHLLAADRDASIQCKPATFDSFEKKGVGTRSTHGYLPIATRQHTTASECRFVSLFIPCIAHAWDIQKQPMSPGKGMRAGNGLPTLLNAVQQSKAANGDLHACLHPPRLDNNPASHTHSGGSPFSVP